MLSTHMGFLGIALGLFYLWLLGKAGIKPDPSGFVFYIIATYLFVVGSMLIMKLL